MTIEQTPIVKATTEATALVKPIYEDLAQPAVREVGAFAAETVRAILLPVRKALEGYTEVVERLSQRVAHKLAQTPSERLVQPAANVAGPILEAVRFVEPDSPLHELYAKLLASAMDSATVRKAHPSFVGILNALSPDEARLLRLLQRNGDLPVVTVRELLTEQMSDHGLVWLGRLRNHSMAGVDAGCTFPDLASSYLDNLARLGVVEYRAEQIAVEESYLRIEESPEIKSWKEKIAATPGSEIALLRGFYGVTDFGRMLLEACIGDDAA